VVELARLHKELIDLSTQATPTAFEVVVALHERLRLVARDVMESMLWQLRQTQRARNGSNFERWPSENELPSTSPRGRLWRFAEGGLPDNLTAIKLVNYLDATETCSRQFVAGDVILPKDDNPAWDVMVLVTRDGGRLGLRLVGCRFGAEGATNNVLRRRDVRTRVHLLIQKYDCVLFNSSGCNATAYWSKLPELVDADNVVLEFVVSGEWQEGVEEELRGLSSHFGIQMSIKKAQLRMSAVFERLPG
jgi:hypothetical protein